MLNIAVCVVSLLALQRISNLVKLCRVAQQTEMS